MKRLLISTAALALAGCVSTNSDMLGAAAQTPTVTQSTPEHMASLDPSDSILFWSDDRRSEAFRNMEAHLPGLEVAPASVPRP